MIEVTSRSMECTLLTSNYSQMPAVVLHYYHASFNNAQILETALLINNRKDLLNFLHSLAKESFYDGLTRPETKWKVVQISNITFYANNLKDAPLGAGASLPSYITNNHGLANVSGDDNLCFF